MTGVEQMTQGELDSRIRIRAPLRCDGVGSLDCAEDAESGMRMAVRWLPLGANGEAAADAVQKLPEHPVLPRIRHTGKVGSAAYVAMEFPEGRMLSTFDAPQPAQTLTTMGTALADALAALHEGGMVHGELSPESVLVLPEGRSILWDVPLVMANRLTDRRGEERAMAILTRVAPYLAPERARGMPPSTAADVYALGSTLCTAAGGVLPSAAGALGVIHRIAILDWKPEVPASLPPALRALLERMLEVDPLLRPTAREVVQGLAALTVDSARPGLGLEPAVATSVPAAAPSAPAVAPGRTVTPKKNALVAAVAGVLLVGAGSAVVLWPAPPQERPAVESAVESAAAEVEAPARSEEDVDVEPDVGDLLSPLISGERSRPVSRRARRVEAAAQAPVAPQASVAPAAASVAPPAPPAAPERVLQPEPVIEPAAKPVMPLTGLKRPQF